MTARIYQLHRHSLPAANSSHGGNNSLRGQGADLSAGRPEARKSATHSPMSPTTVERTGNIRRYLTPSDLRSLARDWDASIIEDRPDLYEALHNSSYRLTLGERLVAFGRRHGDALTFWLGMVSLVLCCTIVASAVMGVGL